MNKMLLFAFIMSSHLSLLAGDSSSNSSGSDYLSGMIDPVKNKTILGYMEYGFHRGFQRSVEDTTSSVIAIPFRAVPDLIGRMWGWWTSSIYKTAFGSLGLTWNTLAQMNNRMYTLCFPLTQVSFSGIDKKRRAALIQQEEEEPVENAGEQEWEDLSEELVVELEYAKSFLEDTLCCYDNKVPGALAALVLALSAQNNKQIRFYIERAMRYIDKLMQIIKESHCFEEVQQRHELIKRRLGLVCSTFEQIAQSIDTEGALNRTGRMPFSKVSMHAGSGMSPSLLDI